MTLPARDEDDDSEVQEVWDELQRTRDPISREDLLIRLAECALADHDFTDLETHLEIHDAFGDMRALQARYHVAALAVGRLIAQYMERAMLMPLGTEEDPN